MSDAAVIGALIGAGSSVLTLLITRLFDVARWRREDRRWQAEPFRQRRSDALTELHRALTACLPSYVLGDTPQPLNLESLQRHLISRLVQAHRAAMNVKPYIEREQGIAVVHALIAFRAVEEALVELVKAKDVLTLRDASDAVLKIGAPYVDEYAKIAEFLEKVIVPKIVQE